MNPDAALELAHIITVYARSIGALAKALQHFGESLQAIHEAHHADDDGGETIQ